MARYLALALLTSVLSLMTVQLAAAQESDRRIDVEVAGRKIMRSTGHQPKRPNVIRATRGECLALYWSSDEPMTVHLHGYNVEIKITPGQTTQMRFLARATGRFAIETHSVGSERKRHIALGYLEVYPR